MNMINYLFIVLLILFLSSCTNTDDDKENNKASIMFPNYLIINAPSKNPNMPWYVSDFFKKVEQWELETTDYSEHGMYELTQFPIQKATQIHKEAANKFIRDTNDSVARHGWASKEKGLSDGYEQMYGDLVHFVNKEYVFDGETLNSDKPEVLMYYKTEEGVF